MATIPVKPGTTINVENIYVAVTCPECEGSVNMKMRAKITRKNCPKCNRLTYVFTITPLRGAISINVVFIGSDNVSTEYNLSSEEVEITEG